LYPKNRGQISTNTTAAQVKPAPPWFWLRLINLYVLFDGPKAIRPYSSRELHSLGFPNLAPGSGQHAQPHPELFGPNRPLSWQQLPLPLPKAPKRSKRMSRGRSELRLQFMR